MKLDHDVIESGATKKFDQDGDTCVACDRRVETIAHLLLECRSIYPGVNAGTVILPGALGSSVKKGDMILVCCGC